jgi:transcriptional regulator with XRE-family HTH domain
MSDKSMGFMAIADRLKMAVGIQVDMDLAKRLGLSPNAWNMRKARESLPTKQIDTLINAEGLNPEFVYDGTGPVHLDVDGESWASGFSKRMAQSLGLATYVDLLVREGYSKTALKAIASGKQEPGVKLLRDIRRCLQVDMNWLICGDADGALDRDERALVAAYRKAPTASKEFIRHASGMANQIITQAPVTKSPVVKVAAKKQSKKR